jgi:MSHA biogenesis protein MshI
VREAVRWKIKDMVDFPVTAAGIDVLPIPVPAGRSTHLLVAVSSHAILTPCIRDFQAAKLDLAAIDLPEMAQRNIANLFETPQRALAMLVFNAQGGLLTFTAKGELYASRRIDISADDLAHGGENGVFDRVVLDVQRSLDNFDRSFSRLTLARLLVMPVAGAENLVHHLKDNLYQPVETLRITDGLDISGVPTLANPAFLANALPVIGAAMREATP